MPDWKDYMSVFLCVFFQLDRRWLDINVLGWSGQGQSCAAHAGSGRVWYKEIWEIPFGRDEKTYQKNCLNELSCCILGLSFCPNQPSVLVVASLSWTLWGSLSVCVCVLTDAFLMLRVLCVWPFFITPAHEQPHTVFGGTSVLIAWKRERECLCFCCLSNLRRL